MGRQGQLLVGGKATTPETKVVMTAGMEAGVAEVTRAATQGITPFLGGCFGEVPFY